MNETCSRCGTVLSGLSACPKCLLAEDTHTFAGLWLEDELGRGGMGTVFRARHAKLGREVAVKFLKPEVATDPDMRARFEREARALAMLDHPNIVRVYDFGVEEGEPYLVLELVSEGPVSKRLPLSAEEAIRVTREVCAGIAYAHDRGVIHRDIKPENVLLDAQGKVKVSDFGIARVLSGDGALEQVTAPSTAMGSAGFMAPEVLIGASPDARMDVYSTGALLRSLLTGRAPIGELSGLPTVLERVIRKAMAENPDARFPSMRALSDALSTIDMSVQLPPDEQLWMRAVAFVQTSAIAAALWAALLSLTPKVLEKNDFIPLVSYGSNTLAGDRVFTQARFETGAVLAALFAIGLAFGATAWLRRHWRLESLDIPNPAPPLPASRTVFGLGLFTIASYGVRIWAVSNGYVMGTNGVSWLSYLPFFGGLLQVLVLYVTVLSFLEATRRHRSVLNDPLLLIGQSIALVPPVVEFFRTQW